MADLTNNKLFAGIATAILVVLLSIAGYFITRPYVQYEEGQVYKSGNVAVASLRLENKGYFDAEQVLIEASFPELIAEITSGDALSPMTVTSGGKGGKTVVGSIPRINPSQAVYVYFTVDNSNGTLGQFMPGFVRQVTFKNGQGSTESPGWKTWGFGIIVGIFIGLIGNMITDFIQRSRAQSKELKEAEKKITKISGTLEETTKSIMETTKKIEAIGKPK